VADEGEQKKIAEWALRSQSLERLKAMWTLAKADLAVTPEELDTDPYLLNVENGTLDLRTGSLRGHKPEDLITKLAPVEFDVTAKSPTFDKFIKQILVDEELIAFVQRYLGYSLTGSTKERAMAVLHGVGKNGKSTLVELFQDLLGDYSGVANPNTIMQQKNGDATVQYQLAELTGVRFVGISETKRDVKLEESTVKQITGNDTISARSPYGKPFGYRPQFKIWMSTNHKPEIPDGSEAIWDRMVLIPFNQRFEGAKADEDLPEKLREELPGVLAWAVMGCVERYQHGLGTSAAVDRATSSYRSETDPLERFLNEMCELGPELRVPKGDMYDTYVQWCTEEDEDVKGPKSFAQMMNEKGVVKNFYSTKDNSNRIWKGVSLQGNRPVDGARDTSSEGQKSCKQMGGERSEGHFDENSEKISLSVPREGEFSENRPEVSRSSRSVPDVITTPLSWEEDGMEIEYMPEGE
jgi:putative DNA primase/helicase